MHERMIDDSADPGGRSDPRDPSAEPSPEPPDWTLLRSFVEVVRTGSLTAAARSLRTTQPTVGRHVRQLEARAGDALFDRRDGRLVPTERAAELFPWAERVAGEVLALGRAFALPVAALSGPVRITTSEVFAVHVLPALIAPLLGEHPGLSIEIAASDAVEDLVRRDADLAVRFVRPQQPDLLARRVGWVELGLYASPDYLKERGRPASVGDLDGHCIVGSAAGDEVRAFLDEHGIEASAATMAARGDSLLVRMAAIQAGLGIGPVHRWLADGDDALERVLPDVAPPSLPLWLVAHGDLARSRRLRVVFDHLANELAVRFG